MNRKDKEDKGMNKTQLVSVVIALALLAASPALAQDTSLSFFLTSMGPGNGADLGGMAGADQHCQMLAGVAGAGSRTWRAYLSTTGSGGVNARDRIGSGPWYNVRGVRIAQNVADLHSDSADVNKETALDERGQVVSSSGDTPNRHDILTGSQVDGTASEITCENWTGSGEGSAMLGHHDRVSMGKPGSPWNSAHPSRGCSQENLRGTGGDGLLYCFAAN